MLLSNHFETAFHKIIQCFPFQHAVGKKGKVYHLFELAVGRHLRDQLLFFFAFALVDQLL